MLDLTWVFYIDDCNEILIWCVVYSRKTEKELYAQILLLSRDLIFKIYKYGKFYENEMLIYSNKVIDLLLKHNIDLYFNNILIKDSICK